ncbi:MAG: hypothetical protein Q9226_000159 [Calogaya cf. arnoldii]
MGLSDTRQDSLELEARCKSVWVQSYGWTNEGSETRFVHLPPSNAYEHELRSLAPDEPFKIGDKKYLLQVDQASPEAPPQDVQVMSSRPGTNDVDTPAANGQDSEIDRPSTPNPGSGTAVLETPVAKRYQDPIAPSKSSTTSVDAGASQNNDVLAMASNNVDLNKQVNEDEASNIIDLEFKPAVIETGLDVPPNGDSSTQDSESSSHELPHSNGTKESKANGVNLPDGLQIPEARILAQRSTRKRSFSPPQNNEDLDDTIKPITDPSAKHNTAGRGVEGPLRKRQRRQSAAATEESQNSVKSTIHVELPGASSEPSSRLRKSPMHDVEQSQGSSKSTLSTPRNQKKPTEPSSSNRSTRQGQRGQGSSQDQVTRVVFASSTSVGDSTTYAKFLRQYNIKQVKKMNDCDVLCTGTGEIKRTSKLLLATLKGKEVVTDQWIIQSAEQNQLLNTAGFVPEDKKRKQEWGTTLSDAIQRGREGLKPFEGWTINFTPSAKKELGSSWSELKDICLVAGATAVQAMVPRKSLEETDSTIVIAASNEADQATLEERGWRIFNKDIITFSALRGGIDADSEEFLIGKKGTGSAKRKAKKGR